MSEQHDQRSPEQLQDEIHHTRSELGNTLEALRGKFSPGEILDQAVGYFRGSGEASQFSHNLMDTVKQNPIPVTLIGVGLAWLMMGGRRSTPPSSYAPTTGTPGSTGSRIGDATRHTSESVGQVAQGARERMGAAQARAGTMAQTARERTSETVQGAQQRVGETADQVRQQARQQAARAQDTLAYLRQEQPLILGALGFALGAVLGAGLPPTRREDEMLGETRDAYLQRARKLGQEQLEKGKQMATAATQAAQEQANKEGMTQGGLDQRIRETQEKVERVAQASSNAAKEEANRQESASPSQ